MTKRSISISEIVGGRFLAWWRETEASVDVELDLVDTSDGSVRHLLTTQGLNDAALDPTSRDFVVVLPEDREGFVGIWHRSLAGGAVERLGAPWKVRGSAELTWEPDGRWLAVEERGFMEDGASYRVFDPVTGNVQEFLDRDSGRIVGVLRNELIIFREATHDVFSGTTFDAIDIRTGATRQLTDGEGTWTFAVRSTSGPRLVYEDAIDGGSYGLRALAPGKAQHPYVIFRGSGRPWDPDAWLVRGVEGTDWVAVYPGGQIHLVPEEDGEFPAAPGLLVNVLDGSTFEVPQP